MITTKPSRPILIERVRRRLERWRRTRAHPRSPIPDTIWAGAVALARQRGLYQTARALRIDYGALKQHVAAADEAVRATPAFVELGPRTPRGAAEYVIEIDGPRASLRIQLHGVALADLAQLSRTRSGLDA